jgi:hypothetical protein
MARTTTDRGKTTERVASVDPLELHRAIVDAAVTALREGAPLGVLDGYEHFRVTRTGIGIANTKHQRRRHVEEQIAIQKRIADNARRNANLTDDVATCEGFLSDAAHAHAEIAELTDELAAIDDKSSSRLLPASVDSEVEFLAQALASLRSVATVGDGTLGDALGTILKIDRIEPAPLEDSVRISFHLLIPAEGAVLAFGPIEAVVPNRAYRATLSTRTQVERARASLTQIARRSNPAAKLVESEIEALQVVRADLIKAGYSMLAAGTMIRSGRPSIYSIIANELWEAPIPDHIDPGFVSHIRSIYRAANFRWEPRHYSIDVSRHQQLVDELIRQGGSAGQVFLHDETSVKAHHITLFSRDQQYGSSPTWPACVERIGDWRQQSPRAGRSLRAITCPHCGGWASLVIRVPEIPDCVLCPKCHQMPTQPGTYFPDDYTQLADMETSHGVSMP